HWAPPRYRRGRASTRYSPCPASEHRLAERGRLDQEIGRAGRVARVEYGRAVAEKRRVVQDRLQPIFGDGERHDGRGGTVDDGGDVRAHLVDLAVDEALLVGAAPPRINRLAVEVVFHDVVRGRGRDRARHQIAIGIARIADADVAKAIENFFVRQDAVGENEIFDGDGIDAGKRARSGLSLRRGK